MKEEKLSGIQDTKQCCNKCVVKDHIPSCHNPECLCHTSTIMEYPFTKCKCHSPNKIQEWVKAVDSIKLRQEGECKKPSVERDNGLSSPSSFEKELEWEFDEFGHISMTNVLKLKKKYCLDKSVAERDYIKKSVVELHSQNYKYIEKQKVIDDYKEIDKMLIVISAFTKRNTEGYFLLQEWINRFAERKKELKL